ncbi:hypothetical protein ACM3CZ_06120 [Edwardsiella ictaluri]
MGNPHCVLPGQRTSAGLRSSCWGRTLESHERFPERVNVGFMQVVERSHIRLRVYERGAVRVRRPAAAVPVRR